MIRRIWVRIKYLDQLLLDGYYSIRLPRSRSPMVHITVPSRLARFLITAGAQPAKKRHEEGK